MKADIESQIALIDKRIKLPIFYSTMEYLRRRKSFLNQVLNAPVIEIDKNAIKFIYGESNT